MQQRRSTGAATAGRHGPSLGTHKKSEQVVPGAQQAAVCGSQAPPSGMGAVAHLAWAASAQTPPEHTVPAAQQAPALHDPPLGIGAPLQRWQLPWPSHVQLGPGMACTAWAAQLPLTGAMAGKFAQLGGSGSPGQKWHGSMATTGNACGAQLLLNQLEPSGAAAKEAGIYTHGEQKFSDTVAHSVPWTTQFMQ